MSKNEGKHPRGYWMGVGLSIGVAIGVALGPLFENIGIGIAVGIAIGSGIGATLEERNKNNIRPLTEQEKIRQKRSITIGLALVSLMTVILIIIYFLLAR
jgi:hypothetical protein